MEHTNIQTLYFYCVFYFVVHSAIEQKISLDKQLWLKHPQVYDCTLYVGNSIADTFWNQQLKTRNNSKTKTKMVSHMFLLWLAFPNYMHIPMHVRSTKTSSTSSIVNHTKPIKLTLMYVILRVRNFT